MSTVFMTMPAHPLARELLEDAGHEVVQNLDDRVLDTTELATAVARAGAAAIFCFVVDRIDDVVLAASPGLRLVANCGVGTDNLDLDAAARRGVTVTNTPGVLTDATADLAWALLLAVSRNLVAGDALVRAGGFAGWRPLMLLGRELRGARLGIVGAGRIGQAMARRARGWEMEVSYWSRSTKPELEVAVGARRLELDELLSWAEVASVHVALAPETTHLLDARRLALLGPRAILINTARGPVVDEAALAHALEAGTLAGAGLDVYEDEPAVHPLLLEQSRAVLLPHLGSATEEARGAMARLAAESIIDLLAGRRPRNVVV